MKTAGALEMEYFTGKNVHTKVHREEAFRRMGKALISAKRVDGNKGDDSEPNHRSQPVAPQIRGKGKDSIFAPTLPVEAVRTVLMLATTAGLWSGNADKNTSDQQM